jgi:CheY-like chemotaxis protein
MGQCLMFLLNFIPVCASPTFRILVIDDLSDNLFLLQTVLEAEGYEVETADNGSLALAKVENSPPDLILMDVMMPDMNGYEVTQRIRQNPSIPFMPILLVTAHEEVNDIQGLALGANDFIRKPIEFDKLLARIEAFLQFRQNVHSP